MSRYDERSAPTRLYVGHISSRTRTRDLETLFSKYGRVRDVDMKQDFAFVNFTDSRDADEARHFLNGRTFDGSRIVVEFARRGPLRGGGGGGGFSRDFTGRGPPPGTGRCYNCGHDGHWARDCKAGDWKNRCYRCGGRGHVERNCRGSPRTRARSRSRSRSRSPIRHRSRSQSYDSHDRSRSPRKDQRNSGHEELRTKARRSLSRTPERGEGQSRSVSPVRNSQSPSRSRSPSRSPLKREDDLVKSPVNEYQSSSHSGGD